MFLGGSGDLQIETLGMEAVRRQHRTQDGAFPGPPPPLPPLPIIITETDELLDHSLPVRLPKGDTGSAILHNRQSVGDTGSVSYGQTFFVNHGAAAPAVEFYKGILVRGAQSEGSPVQAFLHGEEIPPGIKLSDSDVAPFRIQKRTTSASHSVRDVTHAFDGTFIFYYSGESSFDNEDWSPKAPLGLSSNLLGYARYGSKLESEDPETHLLVLYWPNATPAKAGLCILGVTSANFTTFRTKLASAIAAKRAGQPYEALLERAESLLSYKVNNFASWELIDKFPSFGNYCIST